jgi:hypothetical protein
MLFNHLYILELEQSKFDIWSSKLNLVCYKTSYGSMFIKWEITDGFYELINNQPETPEDEGLKSQNRAIYLKTF